MFLCSFMAFPNMSGQLEHIFVGTFTKWTFDNSAIGMKSDVMPLSFATARSFFFDQSFT